MLRPLQHQQDASLKGALWNQR